MTSTQQPKVQVGDRVRIIRETVVHRVFDNNRLGQTAFSTKLPGQQVYHVDPTDKVEVLQPLPKVGEVWTVPFYRADKKHTRRVLAVEEGSVFYKPCFQPGGEVEACCCSVEQFINEGKLIDAAS